MNFVKFLRTSFLTEHLRWLLLKRAFTSNILKAGYGKCRVIIDCAEVFTERPKSLSSQAATWSDYKHHNTFKFWLELHPMGLFRSSLLVMGVEQVTNFSPEIVGFMIY